MRSRFAITSFTAITFLLVVLSVFLFEIQRSKNIHYEILLPDPQLLIERELTRLPIGEIYHNVPSDMQAGVKETIEAGIAPKITQKIKGELKGRGEIHVTSGIRFDPAGVDMKMIVDPDEFKILKIRGGRQFITSETPGKWVWVVVPLKAGERQIVVEAVVDLKVPKLHVTRPIEVTVYNDTTNVKVNWAYSIEEFVSKNWKEVMGFLVGSGSLAGLTGCWIGTWKKREAA